MPETTGPEIPISERLQLIKEQYEQVVRKDLEGEISIHTYADDLIHLAAERLDLIQLFRGQTGNHQQYLEEILHSKDFYRTYTYGTSAGVIPKDNEYNPAYPYHLLVEQYTGKQLVSHTLATAFMGFTPETAWRKGSWQSLETDLKEADIDGQLLATVFLMKLTGQAHYRIRSTVSSMHEEHMFVLSTGDEHKFWHSKIIGNPTKTGKEGLAFCSGYIHRVTPEIKNALTELYGEDAQQAYNLWSALLYSKIEGVDNKRFRAILAKARPEILTALKMGELDEAKRLLSNLAVKFPENFSVRHLRHLDLTKENVDALHKRKYDPEVLTELIKQRRKAAINERWIQSVQNSSPEVVREVEKYLHQTLVVSRYFEDSEDPFTINEIYYITSIGKRNLKHLVIDDQDNETVEWFEVPTVQITRFKLESDDHLTFKKGNAGKAFLLLYPGKLLQIIQGGQVNSEGEILEGKLVGNVGNLLEVSEITIDQYPEISTAIVELQKS